MLNLWFWQDWKVVLGEFDDTKDDGWEQTFDVRLVFFWQQSWHFDVRLIQPESNNNIWSNCPTLQVEFVFQNPSYNDVEIDWDTALMKVKGEVKSLFSDIPYRNAHVQIEFNDWIAPACFPTPDQQFLEGQVTHL